MNIERDPCEHDIDWKKDHRCRKCGENFWNPGKD